MPIRKVSISNGGTTHINTSASTSSGTQVKRVTLGRPVQRVTATGSSIGGLTDINFESPHPEDGDVLVYHDTDEKWHAQKLLDKQVINGGQY